MRERIAKPHPANEKEPGTNAPGPLSTLGKYNDSTKEFPRQCTLSFLLVTS